VEPKEGGGSVTTQKVWCRDYKVVGFGPGDVTGGQSDIKKKVKTCEAKGEGLSVLSLWEKGKREDVAYLQFQRVRSTQSDLT